MHRPCARFLNRDSDAARNPRWCEAVSRTRRNPWHVAAVRTRIESHAPSSTAKHATRRRCARAHVPTPFGACQGSRRAGVCGRGMIWPARAQRHRRRGPHGLSLGKALGTSSDIGRALASFEDLRSRARLSRPRAVPSARMFGGYLWYRAVSFPLERRTARKIGYLTVASPALGGELVVRYARSDWRPARFREWRTAERRVGVSLPALWPTRSFEDELFS